MIVTSFKTIVTLLRYNRRKHVTIIWMEGAKNVIKLVNQLEYISQSTGIPVTIGESVSTSTLSLSRSDQNNTVVVQGTILDKSVLFMSYGGQRDLRPLGLYARVSQVNRDPLVFIFPQLSANERHEYLKNRMPFMTSDGEMFLPFMGTRLLPEAVNDSPGIAGNPLASAAQRLALTIVLAQLIFERHPEKAKVCPELAAFRTTDDRFLIKSGQCFASTIGKQVSINNRVTFSRAVKPLVAHGWLKSIGETKERVYTCELDSRRFFDQIAPFLVSPVQSVDLVQLAKASVESASKNFLYSGLTGLSKVTMISDNRKQQTVIMDRSRRQTLRTTVDADTDERKVACEVQVSKYQLSGFNTLFRLIANYPKNVLDPFHLYVLFRNDMDERTQGEAEELVDQIWNGA